MLTLYWQYDTKEAKIKFCKVTDDPLLLYESEVWTTTTREESRKQVLEVRFPRQVKEYTKLEETKT